jgi:hypothetical protein
VIATSGSGGAAIGMDVEADGALVLGVAGRPASEAGEAHAEPNHKTTTAALERRIFTGVSRSLIGAERDPTDPPMPYF